MENKCNGTGEKKLDSPREKIEQVVYDHVYVGMNDAGLPYLSIQDEFHTEIIALLPKPIDLPELRETIKKTLCKENGICIRCQVDGDVCFECQLDQIIVLIEPLIKDAREQERKRYRRTLEGCLELLNINLEHNRGKVSFILEQALRALTGE